LRQYFGGERDDFADIELDLSWMTPFQRAVAEALRAISYGEAVTYGELAALAGHPNAQRAVGTFCAHNRFGIVVPCHRVVAADGLGSYGSLGTEYKRRLLALEGHEPL
jgi:methylated-DNA-[protein]-cysteine S-methyltransferase